jgi:hypothetical protein
LGIVERVSHFSDQASPVDLQALSAPFDQWRSAQKPTFCDMMRKMAKSPTTIEVTCPCCSALLKIDVATAAVIAHTAAVKPKMFSDMEEAARAMKEQDSRRESIFRQSVEAQKHASELLEKKFQEAIKKAKETPDTGKPIRDFDLD